MRLWLRLPARKEMREGTASVKDEGGRRSIMARQCWEWSSDSDATAPWTIGGWWHNDALTGRQRELKVAASWSCYCRQCCCKARSSFEVATKRKTKVEVC